MIRPTPGRVVWFTPPRNSDPRWDATQPLSASVAYVHNERLINIGYLDPSGQAHSATSVQLLQDDDARPTSGNYCEWMPYEKGQAARTEDAIRMVANAVGSAAGV